MLSSLIRRRWPIPVLAVALVAVLVGGGLVAANSGDDALVVYNGRSHYGDEQVFADFEDATGIEVELRGGTGPELYERLRREGDDTPADVLVTTDLANLWRADESGLLQPVDTPTLEQNVPPVLHEDDGSWWAITTRLRVPVVATERVSPDEVTSYESLGDPRFRGRTCLRTSNNEYNQSLVADMIAKRGAEQTEALLRSWMENDPTIINSDGELLAVMAAGDCDVGLVNHYYLARTLEEDPDFPVAPAWPDQDGAGAHANVSGAGVVQGSDRVDEATQLLEFLTSPEAQEEIVARGEFAANPTVPPAPVVAGWADVKIDPIAVNEAGPLLDQATALMLDVGWN
ncbi:MAG TPA: extracellular solute-binding protein [Acidimicrobiales bacterium]|nr:extracellular solute-binding protein [Acidimicrobiales bacterium]